MSDIAALFGSIQGQDIPGGCDQCEAVQRVEQVAPGIWSLVVAHDDDCAEYRAMKARTN